MKLKDYLNFLNEEGEFELKNFEYSSLGDSGYTHDTHPSVFVLDNQKREIIGINLNYLTFIQNDEDKKKFVKEMNDYIKTLKNDKSILKYDKKVIDKYLDGEKLTPSEYSRVKRIIYKKLIQHFPELEWAIRRYKKHNIYDK